MGKSENINEEINLFIVNFLAGEINDNEVKKLNEWLESDKSNQEYFNNLRNTWIQSGTGKKIKPFDINLSLITLQKHISGTEKPDTKKIRIPNFTWFHVAAAALVFFMLGGLASWFAGKKSEPSLIATESTEISCPYGSKSKVILPDSSEVWLNAGSSLRYKNDYNMSNRNVTLVGEAFFSVTTNKSKPFTVNTSRLLVKAFGTRFNVKSYPEENTESAVLVEGKINVEIKNVGKKAEIFNLKPNERLVLHNENVEVTSQPEENIKASSGIPLKPVKIDYSSNVKTELYTSWKDDRWVIESEPLGSLVLLLERRYNLKFTFVNDELMKYKFTGIIQNETINQIMEALRLTAPLNYKIVKDSVILHLDEKLSKKYVQIVD